LVLCAKSQIVQRKTMKPESEMGLPATLEACAMELEEALALGASPGGDGDGAGACEHEPAVELHSRRRRTTSSFSVGSGSRRSPRTPEDTPAEFVEEDIFKSGVWHGSLETPLQFWAFHKLREGGLYGRIGRNDDVCEDLGKLEASVKGLAEFVRRCDVALGQIAEGKQMLEDLEKKHATVREKTSSLHETCRKLLEEQVKFERIVKDIEEPLSFLKELDLLGPALQLPLQTRLTKLMKNAGEIQNIKPVKPDSPRFGEILKRIDECIQFIEKHPEYKDYEEYSVKFHQLHLRGLTLLRNLVVDSLEKTSHSARAGIELKMERLMKSSKGDAKWTSLEAEINSLLYIHYFPPQAEQLRGYIEELERRVEQKDASDLLMSCQSAYCNLRLSLLAITIPKSGQLQRKETSLIQALRSVCPFLLSICKMEYKLFHNFFSAEASDKIQEGSADKFLLESKIRLRRQPSWASAGQDSSLSDSTSSTRRRQLGQEQSQDAFLKMMTELCGLCYDLVRPLVVKLGALDVLCEAVRVIEGEIIEGQIEVLGEAGAALRIVVIQILRDVQERLIFSTTRYIQGEIADFQPTSKQLDYPRILEDAVSDGGKSSAIYAGCYKTLENTLMCLGLVYRCVDLRTFEELAQEAVAACAQSLKDASEKIASGSSKLDADLFFIKHLLVLREQISPFNTQMAVKQLELDFSTTTHALSEFLAHSRHIFSREHNAVVELMAHGVPLVKETEIDCKRDLETQLKHSCENFIKKTYSQALAQTIAFLHRAAKSLDDTVVFQEQEFAKPERILTLLEESQVSVPEFLAIIRAKMSLYLGNKQTESILFKPIRANILAALSQTANVIEANYEHDDAAKMLKIVASMRYKLLEEEKGEI